MDWLGIFTYCFCRRPRSWQVNGQDLSKSSHEEAVEAFRTAKEPIVVEVLRRVSPPGSQPKTNSKMKSRSPALVSIGTQTDELIENGAFYGLSRPPTPPPALYNFQGNGLYQPSSRQPVAFSPSAEMGLTDIEMANGCFDYDDAFEDDRAFDMEYEEVTLHRANSEEKIGLTLCYGAAEDEVTDIFISEIEPYSIAAQDGRIREGDQILQINGQDVHSREQAIFLFSQNRSDITLLLARPQLQMMDDGFMDGRHCMLDDLHMEMLDQHHHNVNFPANLLRQRVLDEEGGTTDTATTENSSHKHEKDSGVGRTDDSTKNDESSEQELLENECTSPATSHKFQPKCNLGSGELHYSNDSFTSNETHEQEFAGNEISAEECDKFREVLESRCSNKESGGSGSPEKTLAKVDSQSSLEREIAVLNKEMEHIQFECQEIVDSHLREQTKLKTQTDVIRTEPPYRSPRMVPRMGTRLEYLKMYNQSPPQDPVWVKNEVKKASEKEKDSNSTSNTSAYNTGESCRSTPLMTLELNQTEENGNGLQGSMLCLAAKPSQSTSDSEKSTQTIGNGHKHRYKERKDNGHIQGDKHNDNNDQQSHMYEIYDKYANVMYTNKANLEHTMKVQQQIFHQQMMMKKAQSGASQQSLATFGKDTDSNIGNENLNVTCSPMQGQQGAAEQQMEWVVKRRADGSRYITRRPVRNKLLKERAKKLAEERCGMTTDDDAMSELKTGRYWSKEDRKKHVDRAREHKKRKELMLRQKMETLKEQHQDQPEKKETNIVELSHKKMNKHKGKKMFDDFTTVQEMLAHGSKVPDPKGGFNPLLSVTTV
ncbi:E3 ubiquitin-protein ligase PDZRN3-like isoform X3 [Lineus longissimus]|uniref:E3 ubiquitin-protein ligase PDZRN3-like isoform X3 n=1 Tax=Lineus longissimus TaxID=88925 RepID=UPI00315C8276